MSTSSPSPSPTRSGTDVAVETAETDPAVLHRLVVDHGDAVYRLALSIVGNRSTAEDITQEALVKAWQKLPTLRDQSALRSWLLRIAHNTAISTIRSQRAMVVDPQELPEQATASGVVENEVQDNAAVDQLLHALDDLDDLSKSIVVLREIEGMSYDEIAEVLDVPLPTVKTRLLRARRRLGTTLREWA